MAPAPTPTPQRTDDDQSSRTGFLVLIGFLVVLLIAGAVWLLPQMFESAPDEEQVPNLIGLTADEARAAIADAGLRVGDIDYENSDTVEVDKVIRQEPARDLYVAPDTAVDFVVSSGRPEVEVPFVAGQPKDVAKQMLEDRGLKVRLRERDSDEPVDQVIGTNPEPGTSVAEGATITVFWSDGPEEVPNVVGRTRAEAEKAIRDAGFEVEVREDTTSTAPKDTVVDQIPPGGTADQGDTITIFVSVYEEPVETETPTPTETPTTPTETPTVPTESPTTSTPRRS